jgi:glycine dehydrogenase subunit 2
MRAERTIFTKSRPGRRAFSLPELDVRAVEPEEAIPRELLREGPPELPEVSEPEIARHFINLSVTNHHVDRDLYPLGSCTMKYNPKINEDLAALPGFSMLHPLTPDNLCQGALRVMDTLGRALCEITGMDEVSLAPAAGAHGEFTGMLMIRAYHRDQGDPRRKVLIPDSSHGTNPASVTTVGYESVQVKSDSTGRIDLEDLAANLDDSVAAIMITNPNTLGLFETNIREISRMVHEAGGLVYMDGANMNALLGISRPGDFGIDVAHLNLHKTFSTPHGGGGPGSGPVTVMKHLAPYLPVPMVEKTGEGYRLVSERPGSVGRVHTFYGNFGVLVKALAYIMMLGREGLRDVAENAVINANYLMAMLRRDYSLPYDEICKHEFVLCGKDKTAHGVRTMDVAKRLMDFGFHPPTVYFPLIVEEALMIEPTETESRHTLDAFAEAMRDIAREITAEPERLKQAPRTTPVARVNEALAARDLDVAE